MEGRIGKADISGFLLIQGVQGSEEKLLQNI